MDEPDEKMQKRILAVGRDPSIHDPEALEYLLRGMSATVAELSRALSARDATIQGCHRLAAAHAAECGVTAMIATLLSVFVNGGPIQAPTGFEPFLVKTRRGPDGNHIGFTENIATGEVIAEGPSMADPDAAARAAAEKTAEKLGFDLQEAAEVDMRPVNAMRPHKTGTMH